MHFNFADFADFNPINESSIAIEFFEVELLFSRALRYASELGLW